MTSHENTVHLVGRVAAAPEVRLMPSGDEAVIWRIVVDRADPQSRARVDTLECIAWAGGPRRTVIRWRSGDTVEIDGALRRRFWRTPGGPASRYEPDEWRAPLREGVSRRETLTSGARRATMG